MNSRVLVLALVGVIGQLFAQGAPKSFSHEGISYRGLNQSDYEDNSPAPAATAVASAEDGGIPTSSIYVHVPSFLLGLAMQELPNYIFITFETEISPALNFVSQPTIVFGNFKVENTQFTNVSGYGITGGLRKYFNEISSGWYIQGDVGAQIASLEATEGYKHAEAEATFFSIAVRAGSADRESEGFHYYWDVGYVIGGGSVNVTSNTGNDGDYEPPVQKGIDINLGIGFGF